MSSSGIDGTFPIEAACRFILANVSTLIAVIVACSTLFPATIKTVTPENADVASAHHLLHCVNLILRVQGKAALVDGDALKTEPHAIRVVTTVDRSELDSRHTAENY